MNQSVKPTYEELEERLMAAFKQTWEVLDQRDMLIRGYTYLQEDCKACLTVANPCPYHVGLQQGWDDNY